MEDDNFIDTLSDSFSNVVDNVVEYTPRVLVAILLIILGVVLANLISKWITKLVEMLETSKVAQSTVKQLGFKNLDINGIVKIFVYWTVLLIFFGAAVDVLKLDVLTDTFNALIGFVPNLLAAALIAGLSLIAANISHDVVLESAKKAGINAYKFLAIASKVAVLVFGLPLAATQLGLDLSILSNNLTVVVAGIMLALGLAFGLGGRDMAQKMLQDLHDNWKK